MIEISDDANPAIVLTSRLGDPDRRSLAASVDPPVVEQGETVRRGPVTAAAPPVIL